MITATPPQSRNSHTKCRVQDQCKKAWPFQRVLTTVDGPFALRGAQIIPNTSTPLATKVIPFASAPLVTKMCTRMPATHHSAANHFCKTRYLKTSPREELIGTWEPDTSTSLRLTRVEQPLNVAWNGYKQEGQKGNGYKQTPPPNDRSATSIWDIPTWARIQSSATRS